MFDPTEGTRTDGSVPVPSARLTVGLAASPGTLGTATLLLTGLILALLLYVAKSEWYDPWRARRILRGDREFLPRLCRRRSGGSMRGWHGCWRAWGCRAAGGDAGRVASRAKAFLAAQGPEEPDPATVEALTVQFAAARYGASGPPSDTQVQAAEQALRTFAASARRLRWARAWRRFWPPKSPRRIRPRR